VERAGAEWRGREGREGKKAEREKEGWTGKGGADFAPLARISAGGHGELPLDYLLRF